MAEGSSGVVTFVGRADALTRVRAVADGRGSVGRTLLVTGPRGSGRTSLLRQALAGFEGDVMWLSGSRSSGSETGAAVRNAAPAVRAVDDFARAGSGQLVEQALTEGLPPSELGRLVAERYRAMPHRERPVVVVADDLHRCDPYSLELLAFLAHRNHTFDVSYLLTCPDHDLPDGVADLDRLELDGLPVDDAREALSGWTGATVAVPVAEALTALTDGNPFLLREVGGVLTSEQLEGRRTLPVRVAASAASLAAVEPVLDGLAPDELRALACFALGPRLPTVVLDRVAGAGAPGALLDRHLVEAFPGGLPGDARTALGWLAEARLGAVGPARPGRRAGRRVVRPGPRAGRPARHRRRRRRRRSPGLGGGGRWSRRVPAADDRLAEALAWAVVGHADPPTTHDWLELTARAERAGHLLDAREAFEQAVSAPAVDEADLLGPDPLAGVPEPGGRRPGARGPLDQAAVGARADPPRRRLRDDDAHRVERPAGRGARPGPQLPRPRPAGEPVGGGGRPRALAARRRELAAGGRARPVRRRCGRRPCAGGTPRRGAAGTTTSCW